MNPSTQLRRLLQQTDMIVAPGAYDGITARLIEQAGFPAVYMTGAGAAASLGFPDYGILTMSEMVEKAATIARSISVPLVADADTGYGNELNVTRTIREYESRGVAALHIEDQVSPKRCGHLDGKQIVSQEEFLAKIGAAVAARRNPDFVIIARTDARAVESLASAITRANAALARGADIAFVEAVQSFEEAAQVPKLVHGPCLLNIVQGGKTPDIDLAMARAMNYRLAILPAILLTSMIAAADEALGFVKREGRLPAIPAGGRPQETFRRFGADQWDALRQKLPVAPT